MSELINNREHRVNTLKEIILHLHQGLAPGLVKTRLVEIVREVDAGEIAAMEQQLMSEGMSVDEVRSMCDLHSQVLKDVIRPPAPRAELEPGHPVETFRRENRAIEQVTAQMQRLLVEIAGLPPDTDATAQVAALRGLLNQLMDVEKHYARKENLLFPCLERHGVTGPSKVMWGKDDEVRALLKTFGEALRADEEAAGVWQLVARSIAEPALAAVAEMIVKEEKILLPMSLETLTDEEWGEIWRESPRFGWSLVEAGKEYRAPEPVTPAETIQVPRGKAMVFPSGALSYEQLLGLFSALPVDLTFVDADDRVAFFSEGPDRVFARAATVIGRKVQHCHPPKSVDTVERILADFKSGRQNVAEFWIELHGRFVHICYFAVRDPGGSYLGTLEVTQDLTRLRALTGERRLLNYDPPASKTGATS